MRLPDDYRALMRRANGGSKEFGNSWIELWPIQELVEKDEGYPVPPGYTYFGSNGAGEGYAWDWRPERPALYVVMDFVNGSASAVPCGNSLEEFLATLHAGIPFGALRAGRTPPTCRAQPSRRRAGAPNCAGSQARPKPQ